MNSATNIIATVGPASASPETLSAMRAAGADLLRLNFAWLTGDNRDAYAALVRGVGVPVLADLPGPRVQGAVGHTYDPARSHILTPEDEESLAFAVAQDFHYIGLSFVGSAADIAQCRERIAALGGAQKIVAKIERKAALDNLGEIIAAADAVMVARGDLGTEVPLEEIPFVQQRIISEAKAAGKPVITATQMLLSMTEHGEPTRAEVTDVEAAVMEGADAVMLSEETATGKYPVEAVAMMERIVANAERHLGERRLTHALI